MPSQMEKLRDGYFNKLLQQVEQMVAADPQQRPAVVIGFSLGCRFAKYFLHFCHAHRGEAWIAANIQHFVPLGGPWLGAVKLMKVSCTRPHHVSCVTHALMTVQAVMIDGSFEPLDSLFSESQMLTILRSVPVGRYLQPTGVQTFCI